MRRMCHWILWCCFSLAVMAQPVKDSDYLPSDMAYDPAIPTPSAILGAPVGEWHVRHDQLVSYMYALADASDRVQVIETGRTHENRPLLLLVITAEKNKAKVTDWQKAHLQRVMDGTPADKNDPLFLWMGYSVHGDEASGSNAALLVAYYLAAGQGPAVTSLLDSNVVLLDPSINPDGLARFAQWANMHKGRNLVADPEHREHVQGWPSGRTNHYWFDLNRDWLLLTHPESRARIAQFHQWRPHVLTDFHEMGADSSYFFQPGVPSRKNPWTPANNVEMTEALGKFHAAALDKKGELYYTQQDFDDFYYGKGSTYPDAHGSVGILFEQGSSRGHLQDTINGPRHFSDAIANQFATSLSTFAGAMANKQALLNMPSSFAEQTASLAKKDDVRGYLIQERFDATRLEAAKDLLRQHHIRFQGLEKPLTVNETTFDPVSSVFVPLEQPQYRLIKSLFSTRTRFDDNTFYDVSTWNLALAFNFEWAAVEGRDMRKISVGDVNANAAKPTALPSAYAYGFYWQDSQAPAMLQRLLRDGVQARVSGQAFSAQTPQGTISFPAGSVVIPAGLKQPQNLTALLSAQMAQTGITVWPINSGLTPQGIDLGSASMVPVKAPRVLLVGGRGTSQYEAGEVWHYLDQTVDMPVSIIELSRLAQVSLDNYTHMIWVSGRYDNVDEPLRDAVEQWVEAGGVLIGQQNASRWFAQQEWLPVTYKSNSDVQKAFETDGLRYADKEALASRQRVAGAAFEVTLDLSHPLAFGYTRETLPVFRNRSDIMQLPQGPFLTVAQYTASPLMAGYASAEMEEQIAGSAALVATRRGQGLVIGFSDNPVFRGYWRGTQRLFANALFMSPLLMN
ncbi:M14 metallopeptidase family protein [Fluctibacter halophilus]